MWVMCIFFDVVSDANMWVMNHEKKSHLRETGLKKFNFKWEKSKIIIDDEFHLFIYDELPIAYTQKVQMENRWLLPIEVLKKIDPMGLQTLQTGCRYILTVKISIMLKRHRLVSSQKRLIALNSNP